jgi:hypothetical protein
VDSFTHSKDSFEIFVSHSSVGAVRMDPKTDINKNGTNIDNVNPDMI